jgi:hypothetical protein
MFKPHKSIKNIALTPMRFQTVTPEEFLKIYKERASDIRSASIIPPRLGNKHFGLIRIEWKNPVLVSPYDLDAIACA